MLRYQILKETSPGNGNFQPTGQIFTGTSDGALAEAASLQAADTSGYAYNVFLLGPA